MKGQSPAERLTRVDAEDRVIGPARRDEIHLNKWLHRAIHVIVENPEGTVFLQRRSRFKDTAPRKWGSSASGHVNFNESYAVTAVREVEEELGISPENQGPLLPIGQLGPGEETGWEFVHIYQMRHPGPFQLPPEEVEEGDWFPVETIDRWLKAKPEAFAHSFAPVWKVWQRSR